MVPDLKIDDAENEFIVVNEGLHSDDKLLVMNLLKKIFILMCGD